MTTPGTPLRGQKMADKIQVAPEAYRHKHEEKWNARFKELLGYKSGHGDCNVPYNQGKLGNWVSLQRSAYKAGSLAQDRIDRLSSIGFKWALQDPNVPWKTRFKELVQYKAKHGDCNIPQSQLKLGSWVRNQREVYKKNKLSPDRVDRLNGIGFKWALKEAVATVPWETRFDELVQYKAKHDNCNVPQRQGHLGRWVNTQRDLPENKLSQDRIDRLNDIGFDWTPGKGRPKKRKALPITQELSSLDKESVSLLGENVESVPVVAGTSGFESNRFKDGDCASGPALSLPAISSRSHHNLGKSLTILLSTRARSSQW
ncbi:hypothetical protein THAOC_08901 [Thalassiosira oceanica]|uniref:Helicase-associated domain-containing protein n=1 Tax=Thalassiosira oceanica TaxID=159749 RepID=K0SXW3_THAOC|nr:hypothetical protein THAOC_08901 [Thalassiosira oceanica]|eukprot:EJK69804.1 hypothetical protein THAOC_08901 [Thalassiosira oceanica]